MKVTIKDIAHEAEVSVSAVSLALNNKPGVSDDTRERIVKTARQMGYDLSPKKDAQPDAIVRVLKIQRHGHTINSSHNFFIDAYVDGINAIARTMGVTLEIGTYGVDTPISVIAERMTTSLQIKGYLILGTELSVEDVQTLVDSGRNMVFMDTFLDYIPADFVDMNNTDAVYKAVSYLIEHGHRQIGLLKSSIKTRNFFLREEAFYKVMDYFGLQVGRQFIIDVDSTFDGAYKDMKRYLKKSPELPTACFAINDIVGLGCMKALQESGFTIPDDLSLIAFDNLPMASMVSPALTTIEVSQHKIGQNALTMLLSKSGHNECTSSMKTMIGGKLIERESVKQIG
jgi:LacI family transcriptional regulator